MRLCTVWRVLAVKVGTRGGYRERDFTGRDEIAVLNLGCFRPANPG